MRRVEEDQHGEEGQDVVHGHEISIGDLCEDGLDRAHAAEGSPLELEQMLAVRSGALREDSNRIVVCPFDLNLELALFDLLDNAIPRCSIATSVDKEALKALAAGSKEEGVGVGGPRGKPCEER